MNFFYNAAKIGLLVVGLLLIASYTHASAPSAPSLVKILGVGNELVGHTQQWRLTSTDPDPSLWIKFQVDTDGDFVPDDDDDHGPSVQATDAGGTLTETYTTVYSTPGTKILRFRAVDGNNVTSAWTSISFDIGPTGEFSVIGATFDGNRYTKSIVGAHLGYTRTSDIFIRNTGTKELRGEISVGSPSGSQYGMDSNGGIFCTDPLCDFTDPADAIAVGDSRGVEFTFEPSQPVSGSSVTSSRGGRWMTFDLYNWSGGQARELRVESVATVPNWSSYSCGYTHRSIMTFNRGAASMPDCDKVFTGSTGYGTWAPMVGGMGYVPVEYCNCWPVAVPNNAPNQPVFVNPPLTATVGESVSFTALGTDPDTGDRIRYYFDQDNDGSADTTTGLVFEGTSQARSFTWTSTGTKSIVVWTRDDDNELSPPSIVHTIDITESALTPTGLTVTPDPLCESGVIEISWNPVIGADTYTLKDMTQPSGDRKLQRKGTATSFTHSGLATSSLHSYQVRAETSSENGPYTTPLIDAYAPPDCAPAPAPNLNSTGITGTGAIEAGSTIDLNAGSINNSTAGTGVGFDNVFEYRLGGSMGDYSGFSPVPVTGTTDDSSPALNPTDTDPDSTTFTIPLNAAGFELIVQHCVDTGGAIAEPAASETSANHCSQLPLGNVSGVPDPWPKLEVAPPVTSAADGSIERGNTIQFEGLVTNTGNAPAGAFDSIWFIEDEDGDPVGPVDGIPAPTSNGMDQQAALYSALLTDPNQSIVEGEWDIPVTQTPGIYKVMYFADTGDGINADSNAIKEGPGDNVLWNNRSILTSFEVTDGGGTAAVPTLDEVPVINTDTTATFGAEVTSDGGSPVTTREICWGTASDALNTCELVGTGTGVFTIDVTGLTPDTDIYYQADATNAIGDADPELGSFRTDAVGVAILNPAPPTVSPTPATTNGTVNFNGIITNDGSVLAGPYSVTDFFIDDVNDGNDDANYQVPSTDVSVDTNPTASNNTTGSWINPPAGEYRVTYFVDLFGPLGAWSDWSAPFIVADGGGGAPNPPTGLNATPDCSTGNIELTWTAPTGPAPDTYTVYRDGSDVVGIVTVTSLSDSTVTDGVSYEYTVVANSGGENSSEATAPPVTAGYRCVIDLDLDYVTINHGAPNAMDGDYPNAEISFAIGNDSDVDIDPGDSIPYVYTLDFDDDDSIDFGPSPVVYYGGGIGISAGSGYKVSPEITDSSAGTLPPGDIKVCLYVNVDGVEFPGETNKDDNDKCTVVPSSFPRPFIDIYPENPEDALIRSGDTAEITWTAHSSYSLECSVTGAGNIASYPDATFDASQEGLNPFIASGITDPLTNTGVFTITCTAPLGHTFPGGEPTVEESVTIEVIPDYQER